MNTNNTLEYRTVYADDLWRVVLPKPFRTTLDLRPKQRLQATIFKSSIILTRPVDGLDCEDGAIDSVGRFVVPVACRRALKIHPHQGFTAALLGSNSIVLTKLEDDVPVVSDQNPLLAAVKDELEMLNTKQLLLCLTLIQQMVPQKN